MADSFGQTYGRWEFRARTDLGRGLRLGDPALARLGEAPDRRRDRHRGGARPRTATRRTSSLHSGPRAATRSSAATPGDFTQWHTFAVDWLPDRITWYVDGRGAVHGHRQDAHPGQAHAPDDPARPGPGEGLDPAPDATTPAEVGCRSTGCACTRGRAPPRPRRRPRRPRAPRRRPPSPTATDARARVRRPNRRPGPVEPARGAHPARAGRGARPAAAHRRAGRGDRRARPPGARRGGGGRGQDRDDGRARRLAGRHGAGAPGAGPGADVHPQGRPAARRAGALAAAPPRRAHGCSTSSTPRGERRAALLAGEPTDRHLPRLRRAAGRRARAAAARRARRPAAGADGVVAARAPGGHAAGPTTSTSTVVPATVTDLAARAGRASWGSTSSSPEAVRAHAERMAAVLGRPRRAASGSGPSRRRPTSGGSRRSASGWRCCRWWRRSPRASGPSGRSTSPTSSPSPRASPTRTPRSATPERATYRAVLLDEYQDTGHAQRVLLRALFGTRPGDPVRPGGPTVTAVGDPCQSIYGWRGASAGNLARFRTDFPAADGPRRRVRPAHQLPQPAGGAGLANAASAPAARRPPAPSASGSCARGAGHRRRGDVRVALLPDVAAEIDWMADARRRAVGAPRRARGRRPRRPCWCAAAPTWTRSPRRCAPAGCPSRWSGSAGCSTPPRCATWSARCGWSPTRWPGPAAVRLLTGARWRLGVADLAALWARARELVPPPPPTPRRRTPAELALGALPGEQAEQAGLVDALDDPGPAAPTRPTGFARIRRLARELGWLRARARRPAHRPGRRRRARAPARRRDRRPPGPGRPGAPRRVRRRRRRVRRGRRGRHAARAARLPRDRRAGRGRARARRGRGRARPRAGAHRARREGPRVGGRRRAAPGGAGVPRPQDRRHLADQPGRAARPRCAATPLDLPGFGLPDGGDRKALRGRRQGPLRGPRRAAAGRGAAPVLRGAHPGRAGAARCPGTAGPPPATGPGCRRSSCTRSADGARRRGWAERARRRARSTRPPWSQPTALVARRPARRAVRRRPRRRRAGARGAARAGSGSTPEHPAATDPGAQLADCSTSNRAPEPRATDDPGGLGRRRRRAARRARRRPGPPGRRRCPRSCR